MTREHAGTGDAARAKLIYFMPKESFRHRTVGTNSQALYRITPVHRIPTACSKRQLYLNHNKTASKDTKKPKTIEEIFYTTTASSDHDK